MKRKYHYAYQKAIKWMVDEIKWWGKFDNKLNRIKSSLCGSGDKHCSIGIIPGRTQKVEVELEMGKGGIFEFNTNSLFKDALKIANGQQVLFSK